MIRTYIDSSVLIAAASQRDRGGIEAAEYLKDPKREFVSSMFVEIEVYPAARRNRHRDELRFYDGFFEEVSFPPDYEDVGALAIRIIEKHAVSSMDALHIASALKLSADELITMEKSTKGICKTELIDVISLWA